MPASETPLASWSWAADGVALLTLSSPPMNVLSRAMLRAIDACLAALEECPVEAIGRDNEA